MRFNYGVATVAVLAVLAGMAGGCGKSERSVAERRIRVGVTRPEAREFLWRLPVQGTCGSTESANISSRTSGTIDILMISDGDKVRKDDLMFQVDKSKLENNVRIQRQKLEVAKADLATARINSQLADAIRKKALVDFNRARNLQESRAISLDSFEKADLNYQEAMANVEKTKALEGYSQAKLEQEKSALEIAIKELNDSLIRAPFDGTIVDKQKDQGEYAQSGEVIAKVMNLNSLELLLRISANYHDVIRAGVTDALISELDGRAVATVKVSYVAPNVDPLSRTFEIKINLPDRRGFTCGKLYDVTLILKKQRGLGVPNEAIIRQADNRQIVYVVRDGRATAVAVKPGIVDGDMTELDDPGTLADAEIVVKGQAFLNENDPVEIVK